MHLLNIEKCWVGKSNCNCKLQRRLGHQLGIWDQGGPGTRNDIGHWIWSNGTLAQELDGNSIAEKEEDGVGVAEPQEGTGTLCLQERACLQLSMET